MTFARERNGGSGIICRSGKAAGGHRSRGGGIRPPEKERAEFYRTLPVSRGKVAVVCGASDKADLSLFWMRRGRRCVQVCNGDGEVRVSRGHSNRCGEMRDRRPATEGAFSGGAERESAASPPRGNAPRGTDLFRTATRSHARGKSRAGVFGGSRAR